MPRQTRRQFLKQSALIPSAAALAQLAGFEKLAFAHEALDRPIVVKSPANVRQTEILFDPACYTAFPHVVRLNAKELLISFRQAPRQALVRHTHPRSLITIMRSYDLGQTWDVNNATQMAAGGGQELGLINLGNGQIGGLLAMHEVVPVAEAQRAGFPSSTSHEYPCGSVGGFWCWSNNYGLSWKLHHNVLFAPGLHPCAPPIRLESGTILAPCYGSTEKGEFASAKVYRSTDQGKTWSSPTVMAAGSPTTRAYFEPAILEVKPNHILAMHRIGDSRTPTDDVFWRNESRDGGLTWSPVVDTGIVSGACPRLTKLSDKRILLTYGRRFEPYGLFARLSEDGGKSWSETSWLLRKAPNGNQGYSSTVEIEPGRLFTACYAQNDAAVTGITGTFWDLPKRR